MLKTMLPRIIHHLICQCKNPNNKCERLSLLMFILHQEGSFFYCPFLRTCTLYFWNSHIQLIAFCSAQILHPSYACRFLWLLICQSVPYSGYKCVKFAETSSVRLVYLIRLESSQQSATRCCLITKCYYL